MRAFVRRLYAEVAHRLGVSDDAWRRGFDAGQAAGFLDGQRAAQKAQEYRR